MVKLENTVEQMLITRTPGSIAHTGAHASSTATRRSTSSTTTTCIAALSFLRHNVALLVVVFKLNDARISCTRCDGASTYLVVVARSSTTFYLPSHFLCIPTMLLVIAWVNAAKRGVTFVVLLSILTSYTSPSSR